MHIRTILITLALSIPLLNGCMTARSGDATGTYSYVNGAFHVSAPIGLDRAYAASLKGLEALEMKIQTQNKDALGARVVAKRYDGDDVKVNMTRNGPNMTDFSIRIGLFGDKQAAQDVYEEIQRYY